jgi:hypothetical protein
VAVCWFYFDDIPGMDDPSRGLVDRDLEPKPSYRSYRLAAEMLAGATPDRSVRTDGLPGEVYWFRRGRERIGVAWTLDGSTGTLAIRAAAVERIQYLGNRVIARDAADGRLDGITHVPYGADPVYVRPVPGG